MFPIAERRVTASGARRLVDLSVYAGSGVVTLSPLASATRSATFRHIWLGTTSVLSVEIEGGFTHLKE